MRSPLTLLITFFALSCLFSCKKNNSSPGGGGGSVQGNWTFLFLTAQTQATATSSGVTDITKSSYTTTNNTGTMTFTADSVVVNNLSYSANFTAIVDLYLGSTLLDSTSVPYSFSLPATNESDAYRQIGNDSLYFPAGGFTTAGGSGATLASGARYVINKDTLKITAHVSQDQSGVLATGTETVYLLKQ
jgi:hypothetical protein